MPSWLQYDPRKGKHVINIPRNEPSKTKVPYKTTSSRRSSSRSRSNNSSTKATNNKNQGITINEQPVQTQNSFIPPNLKTSKPGEATLLKRNIEKPRIITSDQIKSSTISNFTRLQGSYGNVDPKATYIYNNKEVSGTKLQKTINREKQQNIIGLIHTLGTPTGKYVKKGDRYYTISPEIDYIMEHGDKGSKENIIGSIGSNSFENVFTESYGTLSKSEKEEYGYRFTPFIDQPVDEWKYHPGGTQHLKGLSEKEREKIISDLLTPQGTFPTQGIGDVNIVELSRRAGSLTSKYKDTMSTTDAFKVAKYETVWESLTKESTTFKENTFMKMPWYERIQISGFQGVSDVAFGTVSLPQTIIKLGTGKQVGPDIMGEWEKVRYGAPYDIISTGISEGVGAYTGEGSNAWKRFLKDPLSGISATAGSFVGMWGVGKAFHTGKVGTIKGLGHLRKGIYNYTGANLPGYTKLMYHMPHRYLRRGWIKLGSKKLDDVIDKSYHSSDTLTHGGLSFAPGNTPSSRVQWTVDMALKSKQLGFSDDFLLGSSSGHRIGRRFIIQGKKLHELPSLSTTPYGFTPTRFYRFTPSSLSYSSNTSLLPRFKLPSAFAINVKKIFNPPSGFQGYDDVIKYVTTQQKGSWGMVGPKMFLGGPEAEINIFGKTVLKRFLPDSKKLLHRMKGYQFYTDVPLPGGLTEVAPVVFTKPVHGGFPKGLHSIGDGIKDLFSSSGSSSYKGGSTSVLNLSGLSFGINRSLVSAPKSNSPSSYESFSNMLSYVSKPYSHQRTSYSKSKSSLPFDSSGMPEYRSIGSDLSVSIGSSISKNLKRIIPSYPSRGSSIGSGYSSVHSRSRYDTGLSYKPPVPPPYYFETNNSRKKKSYDPFDFSLGYRERTWKVPEMKDLIPAF